MLATNDEALAADFYIVACRLGKTWDDVMPKIITSEAAAALRKMGEAAGKLADQNDRYQEAIRLAGGSIDLNHLVSTTYRNRRATRALSGPESEVLTTLTHLWRTRVQAGCRTLSSCSKVLVARSTLAISKLVLRAVLQSRAIHTQGARSLFRACSSFSRPAMSRFRRHCSQRSRTQSRTIRTRHWTLATSISCSSNVATVNPTARTFVRCAERPADCWARVPRSPTKAASSPQSGTITAGDLE